MVCPDGNASVLVFSHWSSFPRHLVAYDAGERLITAAAPPSSWVHTPAPRSTRGRDDEGDHDRSATCGKEAVATGREHSRRATGRK